MLVLRLVLVRGMLVILLVILLLLLLVLQILLLLLILLMLMIEHQLRLLVTGVPLGRAPVSDPRPPSTDRLYFRLPRRAAEADEVDPGTLRTRRVREKVGVDGAAL